MTFPWGTITKVHKIDGLPDITEYVVGPQWEDKGKTNFQVEANGVSMSFDKLDYAIMGAMCDKYDTVETADYIWRLLKVEIST